MIDPLAAAHALDRGLVVVAHPRLAAQRHEVLEHRQRDVDGIQRHRGERRVRRRLDLRDLGDRQDLDEALARRLAPSPANAGRSPNSPIPQLRVDVNEKSGASTPLRRRMLMTREAPPSGAICCSAALHDCSAGFPRSARGDTFPCLSCAWSMTCVGKLSRFARARQHTLDAAIERGRLGQQADDEEGFAIEVEEKPGVHEHVVVGEELEHQRFLAAIRRHLQDGRPAALDVEERDRRASRSPPREGRPDCAWSAP